MIDSPKRSYVWLFWLLAGVGLLLDQGSKYAVFAALYEGGGKNGSFTLIPNTFRLTADYTHRGIPDDCWHFLRSISGDHMPHVNHGALFGLWNNSDNGNFFFTLVSLAAAVAIVIWITRTSSAYDPLLCISLGLILAGTLGNLYDRIVFDGVRDFLHWYRWIDWPVFNIADSCLVCGAGLLLFEAMIVHPKQDEEKTTIEASAPSTEQEVVDVK